MLIKNYSGNNFHQEFLGLSISRRKKYLLEHKSVLLPIWRF